MQLKTESENQTVAPEYQSVSRPSERLTKAEVENVVALWAMQKRDENADAGTATIADVAEGLGIPEADVALLLARSRQSNSQRHKRNRIIARLVAIPIVLGSMTLAIARIIPGSDGNLLGVARSTTATFNHQSGERVVPNENLIANVEIPLAPGVKIGGPSVVTSIVDPDIAYESTSSADDFFPVVNKSKIAILEAPRLINNESGQVITERFAICVDKGMGDEISVSQWISVAGQKEFVKIPVDCSAINP